MSSAPGAVDGNVDGGTLTTRAGVHAGEPIEQGVDVFGIQVNVAARLAGAGDILVSSLIRDLAPPGQFQFSDPRTVTLRGIPEQVTLYHLTGSTT